MKGLYTHTGHKLSSFTHMHKCKMVNMHIDVSSNTQIIKKNIMNSKHWVRRSWSSLKCALVHR